MSGFLLVISLAGFDTPAAERMANLALECVQREYPNKIAHVMSVDGDAKPPRELTPSFYGCFDWHSAVHGHWLLARLAREFPGAPFAARARAALATNLTARNLEIELAYIKGAGRGSFERPYGLAWLLQLSAELHEWQEMEAKRWASALEPLEREVAARFERWLPKLSHPIRTGEHSQSAFAMGLVLDWARTRGNKQIERLVMARSRAFYGADKNCNLSYEPGGQDFLSPCLAEADLMRRVMPPKEFAAWLSGFLPEIPESRTRSWLPVAVVTDKADGKLAHLDGLNSSRGWMLEGIVAGLPDADARRVALTGSAAAHRAAALTAVTGEHYAGGHWLGSFAVYLVTKRGLAP